MDNFTAKRFFVSLVATLLLWPGNSVKLSATETTGFREVLLKLVTNINTNDYISGKKEILALGTNAVPLIVIEMHKIGEVYASKNTNEIIKIDKLVSGVYHAIKELGTNLDVGYAGFTNEFFSGYNKDIAAYAIMQMSDKHAECVVEAITNINYNIKLAAILNVINKKSSKIIMSNAVELLLKQFNEPAEDIRAISARAVGKIGMFPDRCLPELVKLLREDSSLKVRLFAVSGISLFQKDAKNVVKELVDIKSKETNDDIIKAIERALNYLNRID